MQYNTYQILVDEDKDSTSDATRSTLKAAQNVHVEDVFMGKYLHLYSFEWRYCKKKEKWIHVSNLKKKREIVQ